MSEQSASAGVGAMRVKEKFAFLSLTLIVPTPIFREWAELLLFLSYTEIIKYNKINNKIWQIINSVVILPRNINFYQKENFSYLNIFY